jgi:predicted nucleotidyltransferase
MNVLAELFSSRVRAEIFRCLFSGTAEELHMRELERRSGCAIGTIQAELKKLVRLDLVVSRRDGNRLYYGARTTHPLYADLCSLVRKTVGVVGVIQAALVDCDGIDSAFVFGSLASGHEKAVSDVDLMVIGTVGLRSLSGKLAEVAQTCGREINPHILSVEEFRTRIKQNDHFLSNVMRSKKLFVRGGEDDLARLGS